MPIEINIFVLDIKNNIIKSAFLIHQFIFYFIFEHHHNFKILFKQFLKTFQIQQMFHIHKNINCFRLLLKLNNDQIFFETFFLIF